MQLQDVFRIEDTVGPTALRLNSPSSAGATNSAAHKVTLSFILDDSPQSCSVMQQTWPPKGSTQYCVVLSYGCCCQLCCNQSHSKRSPGWHSGTTLATHQTTLATHQICLSQGVPLQVPLQAVLHPHVPVDDQTPAHVATQCMCTAVNTKLVISQTRPVISSTHNSRLMLHQAGTLFPQTNSSISGTTICKAFQCSSPPTQTNPVAATWQVQCIHSTYLPSSGYCCCCCCCCSASNCCLY
jgi:hypothetical protein